MISKANGDPLADKANAAFKEVAQDVIARARFAKTEVVVWRDGKVAKLSPDEAERQLTEHATNTETKTAE
jgi:hypothetical protein